MPGRRSKLTIFGRRPSYCARRVTARYTGGERSHPMFRYGAAVLAALPLTAVAQEAAKKEPSRDELIRKLESDLTNVKLIGRYTSAGREDREPRPEEYTITSAVKLPDGDMWLINARIKYGDKDTTVPMPLEIKWAGDTPIITLTELAIPGLGTFTSRVVIYADRYAGTWQHGKAGGHLFGRIEKVKDEKSDK
jgi:hypothetical protein